MDPDPTAASAVHLADARERTVGELLAASRERDQPRARLLDFLEDRPVLLRPVAVQVVAGPFQEHVALAVARLLEQEFGGWSPPPIGHPQLLACGATQSPPVTTGRVEARSVGPAR